MRRSNSDFVGEGEGRGYNVNIPLNDFGCQDPDYLAIFHHIFLPIAAQFGPELVLVSAGYDAAMGNGARMLLTPVVYPHMVSQLSGIPGSKESLSFMK